MSCAHSIYYSLSNIKTRGRFILSVLLGKLWGTSVRSLYTLPTPQECVKSRLLQTYQGQYWKCVSIPWQHFSAALCKSSKKLYPLLCSTGSTAAIHGHFKRMGHATTVLQPHAMYAVAAQWRGLYRVITGTQDATYHFLTNCNMP